MRTKVQIAFMGQALETGMLSEMLILDVLSRIGEARIPQLAIGLKAATRKSKVPFFLGKTVRDVLREQERLRNVQIASRGTDFLYNITPIGLKQLSRYRDVLEKVYPSVLKIHMPRTTADSRSTMA